MADHDREKWTRIVATFEQSGQSQREFAKEQELSLSNLRYWIYRLRKESRPLVTEQAERSVNGAEQPEGLTLKPVRVVGSAAKPRLPGNDGALLALELPSGMVLRFPAGIDLGYLRALVAAL